MRRIVTDTHEDQGYDSFLDIVANLVGILVILIMVIGVRAKDAWQAAPAAVLLTTAPLPSTPEDDAVAPPATTEADPQRIAQLGQALAGAQDESQQLHSNIFELDAEIQQLQQRAAQQKSERQDLQLMVSMAEQALEARRGQLADDQQRDLELSHQLGTARQELAHLEKQKATVESAIGSPNILEHRPTPLAKTVFGTEEHFRLLNGRLAYVPINQMTAMLRRDAEHKLWKLGNTDEVSEIIGPMDGFRMKYTLQRRERRVSTPEGPRVRRIVELKRFVMVPQSPVLGETLDAALRDGSQFAGRLAQWRSDDTTITVWTYADSFAEFRRLKSYLFQRGFLAAARPLPDGYPIGGSPDGSKSAAE